MNLRKLALAKCPILITGPTGAGKSHLAEKIHQLHGAHKSFIEVDVAALHETTFDSQLFGHQRGSFTGAVSDQQGLCQRVKGGTLFLDEMGDLSLSLQKKLLMLIEKRSFLPIGASTRAPFHGNFIFATNRNIGELVELGKFREDLYYRIRVVEVVIGPLSERKEELSKIIAKLISHLENKYQKKTFLLSRELENFLMNHPWPGNIRELKNTLEYLFIFTTGKAEIRDLPHWMMEKNQSLIKKGFYRAMEDFEKRYFTKILEENNGRINETSKQIGISKSTLITKAKKYNINTNVLRARAVM